MKHVLTFACVAIISTSTYCQTDAQYLKTKALQFSFNGLNLSSFAGGVGGKLWLDNRTALSVVIGGSHGYLNEDANALQSGQTNSQSTLLLQFGIEAHTFLSSEFSPYVTGAIFGRYEEQDYKTTYAGSSSFPESKVKSTNVGLLAGFGAEYWISTRVSLAGQQTFQFSYGFGSREQIDVTDTKQNTRSVNVGLGTSSLILSIYF